MVSPYLLRTRDDKEIRAAMVRLMLRKRAEKEREEQS